ncbi:MAG: MarR family winged helix-turn-helix transcriptional regulator [Aristaeellaceae bacterium]
MTGQHVGHLIKSINEKLKARADQDARTHHLTLSQSFVLTYLDSQGGQAAQKDIERFLDVSHPAVTGIISRMEQNGHVTTWPNPGDKRVKIVALTPQAGARVKEMNEMCQHWESAMLDGFSPEETATLKALLIRVNDNLVRMQNR